MILIISTCFEKLSEEEFVRPVTEIVNKLGMPFCVKHYSKLVIADVKKSERIIICGTALRDNEYLKETSNFDWLEKTEKPILGLCAGMQIIALKFGAKLTKEKEIGMIKVKTVKENKLFSDAFDAFSLHGNSLSNLKNFNIIAKSGKSVQAIKHKSKKIYGVMFHPEVRNKKIIENFLTA